MPLRDLKCNECGESGEQYYQVLNGEIELPVCCGQPMEVMPLSAGHIRVKTAIFPFTSTHVSGDGKPVVVHDMGHLRQLERHHGVNFSVFSQDPGNPDSPRELPVNRPGGREFEPVDTRIFK